MAETNGKASQNEDKNKTGNFLNQGIDGETASLDEGTDREKPVEETTSNPYQSMTVIQGQQMILGKIGSTTSCNKSASSDEFFEHESKCLKSTVKIVEIDVDKFQKVCNLMDIHRALGKDYASLGGKLNYTITDINIFDSKSSQLKIGPTQQMLEDWNGKDGHFACEILEILRNMERDDVADLIEQELKRIAKEKQCNCTNCASLA